MPMTNYEMFDFPGDTKRDEYSAAACRQIPVETWLFTLMRLFFMDCRWQNAGEKKAENRRSCSDEIFIVK